MAQTLYDELEVSTSASPETIKAAYKSLMQRFHPDRNPGNRDAEERSKRITSAFTILSDANARARYDADLRAAISTAARVAPSERAPHREKANGQMRAATVRKEAEIRRAAAAWAQAAAERQAAESNLRASPRRSPDDCAQGTAERPGTPAGRAAELNPQGAAEAAGPTAGTAPRSNAERRLTVTKVLIMASLVVGVSLVTIDWPEVMRRWGPLPDYRELDLAIARLPAGDQVVISIRCDAEGKERGVSASTRCKQRMLAIAAKTEPAATISHLPIRVQATVARVCSAAQRRGDLVEYRRCITEQAQRQP